MGKLLGSPCEGWEFAPIICEEERKRQRRDAENAELRGEDQGEMCRLGLRFMSGQRRFARA